MTIPREPYLAMLLVAKLGGHVEITPAEEHQVPFHWSTLQVVRQPDGRLVVDLLDTSRPQTSRVQAERVEPDALPPAPPLELEA